MVGNKADPDDADRLMRRSARGYVDRWSERQNELNVVAARLGGADVMQRKLLRWLRTDPDPSTMFARAEFFTEFLIDAEVLSDEALDEAWRHRETKRRGGQS